MDGVAIERTWRQVLGNPPIRIGLGAAGTGIGLGLVSFLSDYVLPLPWSMIGNLTGTWMLVAFAVGAVASVRSMAWGVLAGPLALVTATVAYYAATAMTWPSSSAGHLLSGVVVWGIVSVLAGPLAGSAGVVWRRGRLGTRDGWWLRPAAVAGVAAVVAAEAVFLRIATIDSDPLVVAAELLVAAVLPFGLLRTGRERATACGLMFLLGSVGLPVMAVVTPLLFRLAGGGW